MRHLLIPALAALLLAACNAGSRPASTAPAPPQFLLDQQLPGSGGPYLVTVDRERYPPHYAGLWHTHPGPGMLCALQGTLSVELRNAPAVTLAPGACWAEPPGTAHRPANTTDGEVVALFYLLAPTGRPRIEPAPSPAIGN